MKLEKRRDQLFVGSHAEAVSEFIEPGQNLFVQHDGEDRRRVDHANSKKEHALSTFAVIELPDSRHYR